MKQREELIAKLEREFAEAKQVIPSVFWSRIWQSLTIDYLGILPDSTIRRVLDLPSVQRVAQLRAIISAPKPILPRKDTFVQPILMEAIRKKNRRKFNKLKKATALYYTVKAMQQIVKVLSEEPPMSSLEASVKLAEAKILVAPRTLRTLRKQLSKPPQEK